MRGGRVPVNLTPQQLDVLLAVLAVLVLAVVAVAVFELLLTGGAALAFRISGRRPPLKSPTRIALEELEERLRRRSE